MAKFAVKAPPKGPKTKYQASLVTPLQDELMELIKQGLTSGEGPLKDLFGSFDKQAFEEGVVQPEMKNFRENILPQILEKYSFGNQALGSGMRSAELKAGTDLQSKLAQLMYQAQQGQQQNRLAGLQTALGRQSVENIVKSPDEKSSIWNKLLPALGAAGGGFLGGPAGAVAGATAGKAIVGQPGR